MADLRDSLSAEAAVLFRICPITDEVRITAVAGSQTKYNDRKERLAWSPIRDAAIDDEDIFTSDATRSVTFPKHRYLVYAYRYKSCVGVPVETGAAAFYAYAIFVFHPDPNHFGEDYALRLAKRTARQVGLFLRSLRLEEEIRRMKPFEMLGQAYGSMAHDLSKDLSSGFMLEEIGKRIAKDDHVAALGLLAAANARLRDAQQIVRSFRDMARGQNEEVSVFSAKQAIADILARLKDELDEYDASFALSSEVDDGVKLQMRRSYLDQLLTNIVLNAVQQIDRLGGSLVRTGEVHVVALVERDDLGISWLVLRIHDNGPGIHHRDFERVFDLHYTTKDQGCGMGLDICRKIADGVAYGKFRGTVRVQRSIPLVGSTFEVRLPVLQEGVA